jgi:hypothetical protein
LDKARVGILMRKLAMILLVYLRVMARVVGY